MKQFLITVAGVLAGLILFLVIAPAVLISSLAGKRPAAPSAVMLQIDLRSPISDQRSQNGLGLFSPQLSTVEIVRKLDAAARDGRVKGAFIRAASSGLAPAQAEEIRTALDSFRKRGKIVIAHMQNDGAQTSLAAYEAIAPTEIWLQETGDFMPMGILAQRMYLGGTLEKFHITAQFEAREQYKDAITQYTERGPTRASQEATTALLNSIYEHEVAAIAADRKMQIAEARAAIESTPYGANDAVRLRLADKLGRPEDAAAAALARAGAGAQMLDLARYNPARASGPALALVTAEGEIVSGPPAGPTLGGGAQINSDAVAKALLDAANDKTVKAIIFRVSSPGGSAVASDQISHAVWLARQKGKKVVVSMGPYAASGGYYVAAGADKIVADSTTITGSIGIFGGKFSVGEAANRYLGANFASTSVGSPNIAMFDPTKPFTADQRKAFAALIDHGYADFLNVVAIGRRMPVEKVHEVAKGRVWSGAEAKERGLVDEIGGLDVAIEQAKALAGLKPEQNVALKLYPQERGFFAQLHDAFGASQDAAEALALFTAIARDERLSGLLAALAADDKGARAEPEPLVLR